MLMGRKPHFDESQFTGAALNLIAGKGPAAVTVASIAGEIGAPIGSVYHRFPSREIIFARLWLDIAESFQEGFLRMLGAGNGLEAALYTPRWVRDHPLEARVLLLYRREELVGNEWPGEVAARAKRLECALKEGLAGFVQERFGSVSRPSMTKTVFALIDVPLAAVRRYIEMNMAPPADLDGYVRKTFETILGASDEDQ